MLSVPLEKLTKSSVALLAFLGKNDGAMVLLDMRREISIPKRTMYTAIRKLSRAGLVQIKTPIWDARQVVVFIDNDEARAHAKILIARRPPRR